MPSWQFPFSRAQQSGSSTFVLLTNLDVSCNKLDSALPREQTASTLARSIIAVLARALLVHFASKNGDLKMVVCAVEKGE
jgi:hypothetical protein